MERGRILVAEDNGVYDIKLVGDVRLVLCSSLNHYIESIFRSGEVRDVLVDLLEATAVDSTTLGLLAKLAIYCNREFGLRPELFCSDEGIYRTLCVMGLDEVFELHEEKAATLDDLQELESSDDSAELRERILEAHKLLIELNPANRDDFIDLIRALEAE